MPISKGPGSDTITINADGSSTVDIPALFQKKHVKALVKALSTTKDPYAGLPDGAAYWWPAPRYVKPRGPCTCRVPQPSVRPSGRLHNSHCTRCHGHFDRTAQIEAGRIVYGIKGKHREKMLWAARLETLFAEEHWRRNLG